MCKKNIYFPIIPFLLAAALTAAAQTPGKPANESKTEVHPMISAGNAFAFDLYKQLSRKDGNVFFSPYSITVALAMAYEGAKGGTAKEMEDVLRLPKDAALRRDFFARDIKRLGPDLGMDMANAFWAQSEYKFLAQYKETLDKYYQAAAFNADFKTAADKTRLVINGWTGERTHGKIKDLFPQDSLNSLTRLVLVDAVYFKGNWETRFDKSLTSDTDFRTTPSNKVKARMMKRTGEDSKSGYYETADLQILEMPYKGGKLSMLILLPPLDGMKKLEKEISPEKLETWRKNISNRRVDVFLPRFILNAKYMLHDTLARMGMSAAFTDKADFSGMDGTNSLHIQRVVHQGLVEVNEEGTEAAAATGVAMGLKSMPMAAPKFLADHPFIFLIQERETGKIIFMGRVEKP